MSSKNYLAGAADDGVAAIRDMDTEITRLRAENERLRAFLRALAWQANTQPLLIVEVTREMLLDVLGDDT